MKKAIILAGGVCPAKRVFNYLRNRKGYDILICADGGLRHADKFKTVPDFIIGDFDSVSPALLKKYEKRSGIIHVARQSDTDVEKAIKFALKKNITHIVLLGTEGGRLDHELGNISCLLRYGRKASLAIISAQSILYPVNDGIKFVSIPGEVISLFSFAPESLFETTGLKYRIRGEAMPFGVWESISNNSVAGEILIKNPGGKAILVRSLPQMLRENLLYER